MRKHFVPEGFGIWCRIEELSRICGYNPYCQFKNLREISDIYPGISGRDPEEYAEEHPMQALACLVRKYFKEYPRSAARLVAAGTKIQAKQERNARQAGMAA